MVKIDNTFEVIFLIGFVTGSVIRKVYTTGCRNKKTEKKHRSEPDTVLIVAAGLGMAAPLVYLFTPWLDFADYDLPNCLGWLGTAASPQRSCCCGGRTWISGTTGRRRCELGRSTR